MKKQTEKRRIGELIDASKELLEETDESSGILWEEAQRAMRKEAASKCEALCRALAKREDENGTFSLLVIMGSAAVSLLLSSLSTMQWSLLSPIIGLSLIGGIEALSIVAAFKRYGNDWYERASISTACATCLIVLGFSIYYVSRAGNMPWYSTAVVVASCTTFLGMILTIGSITYRLFVGRKAKISDTKRRLSERARELIWFD